MTRRQAIKRLKTLQDAGTEYVTYGIGDLGMPIPINDAITDLVSMDDDSWNDGEFYVCDKDGNIC